MNTLLIIGADGWLGDSIMREISKVFLESIDIKQIIMHTKDKKVEEKKHNKNYCNYAKLHSIHGDFLFQKTFDELNSTLKINKTKNLFVIVTMGIIHPKKYNHFKKINFKAIKKIYQICSTFNLIKFTYISSNSPFGFNTKKIPFNESSKYKAFGGYGKSKMMAEKFLLKNGDKNVVTILRAPWFHGNKMPIRQKKFLISSSRSKFPLIFLGRNIRSIINVKDLAIASLLVTSEKRKHQIYWISENNKSMSKIINIIKYASYENGYTNKLRINSNIYLPPGFSSFFFIVDMLLQKLGIYNMYIHVFSEIGQDIFSDNSRYLSEFSHKHKFSNLEQSIYMELEEAFCNTHNK